MSVRAGASKVIRNATPAKRRAWGRKGNTTMRETALANKAPQEYSDTVPF